MKIKSIFKWALRVIVIVLLLGGIVTFIAYWRSTNDCERYSATPNNPMKAVVQCEYGKPDVLQVRDIEKPTPDDTQVLVRVRAASLNPLDGHQLRGGWPLRPMTGLRKPKDTRIGVDYAGVVEAVGKSVTQFKVGDKATILRSEIGVARAGTFAKKVAVPVESLVHPPPNWSDEQAA